jgi:UDP-N-acetylmuramate dehydrogenase
VSGPGELVVGEAPGGELASDKLAGGKLAGGELAVGETPGGELAGGEAPWPAEVARLFDERRRELARSRPRWLNVVRLARRSTMGVGGPALALAPRGLEELAEMMDWLGERGWPWLVQGRGSNLLFPDGGLSAPTLRLEGDFARLELQGDRLTVGAGADLAEATRRSVEAGWSGLECLAGVPGTVGGALAGNAGDEARGVLEVVDSVELVSPELGRLTLSARELDYDYRVWRRPRELDRAVVTKAVIGLTKAADPQAPARDVQARLAARRAKQPAGPSLGSVFKNPPGFSAGRLLDQCGLKGRRVGGMTVSAIHANFIVNAGGGTSAEARELMAIMAEAVGERFGVSLAPEIKVLDPEGRTRGWS